MPPKTKRKGKLFSLCTAFLIISLHLFSQKQPDQKYQLIHGNNIIQAKNYYLLTLCKELPRLRLFLEKDTVLKSIAANKIAQIKQSVKDCGDDAFCMTEKLKFSDSEITIISERLYTLYQPSNLLDSLVQQHLIPSGAYQMYHDETPQALLVKAWQQDARGINFTIGVYAENKKAKYSLIDSCSLNVKSKGYKYFLYAAVQTILDDNKGSVLFFLPSMLSALRFLELNERENAADYEPMTTTVNKAAFDRIKTIKWKDYPYSVIVIPGAGPDDPKVALSAGGIIRCRLAAQCYFKGLAPFLMTSGGRVHPYKTIYNEAYEMKKYLMEKMNVPENAIIMDPHARHTTTNLRNAARLIFRYGLPFSKPALVSTEPGQSADVGATLAARCQRELNIIPFKIGNRLSDFETEFYPSTEALTINPLEPLDP